MVSLFGRDKEKKPPEELHLEGDGFWIRCDFCKEIIYRVELERKLNVCPKCNYHFKIPASQKIKLMMDDGRLEEHDQDLEAMDLLKFRDTKRYLDRIRDDQKKTGLKEAIVCGRGTIHGFSAMVAIMDFDFMGGSMGCVVGEKMARIVEKANQEHTPLIAVSASGGARMQEGLFSLMQMAKTSAALARLKASSVPYISIMTHPTTGGVAASFAMLGDIIIAEPKALIGFAGPRVIEKTIGKSLPEGFQRSEYLLEHGMIDMIVERKDLKDSLGKILDMLSS